MESKTKTDKVPKRGNPNLKGGSRKGKPNKHTGLIREMIAEALEKSGGTEYLIECAHDPKTKAAFLGLIGKVMPVQVQSQVEMSGGVEINVRFGGQR